MKNFKTIILFVFILYFYSNCNNSNKENSPVDTVNTTQIPQLDSFIYNNHSEKLYLNEGEKWELKPVISKNILKIEELLNYFTKDTSSKRIEDYKKLASKISKCVNKINENCDMKGATEEVFHIWIIPFTELSDKLSFSKDVYTSQKLVAEMKDFIKEFKRYFK